MPAPASSPTDFDFDVSRAMGVVVVTAHGQLDAASVGVLNAVLGDLIEGQGNRVCIDLHGITLGDPASLDDLVGSALTANRPGGQLTFTNPCATVAAALEAAGLTIRTGRGRVRALGRSR